MEKLRFDFAVKSTADGKSNVICITSISTPDGQTFGIPAEYQPAHLHQAVTNTANYIKIRKTLNKRHQTRKIWIGLTEEISKTYYDTDGNLQFNDYYLEQVLENLNSNQNLENLLEKFLEEKEIKSETENLGRIAKDFMILKFTTRNSNASQWIKDFNKECERFRINEDKKKIEILKFFLEQAGADWYNCMLIKLTIDSEWDKWERSFCETFANKGWSPIRYALAFKYQAGSLLEYALKKEKLLLEVRRTIDSGSLIDLIVFGLPNYVADKIDRETLNVTEDIYNELGKLEYLVGKSKNNNRRIEIKMIDGKNPCQICVNAEKGKRYHPEEKCWFKKNDQRANVKSVNNSELEIELNKKNPKN